VENPSTRVRKGWIVEEDPSALRSRFAAFGIEVPRLTWLPKLAFRKWRRTPTDDEVEGTNDPSPNSDPNHGKTVHRSLGCDHQKR